MQIFILALFVSLFLHDALGAGRTLDAMPAVHRLLWWLGPKVALVAVYTAMCVMVRRRLAGRHGAAWLKRLDRIGGIWRIALLVLFAVDLHQGVLLWIRRRVLGGDWVLIDEVLILLPTLLAVAAAWWSYYPIDRHLREAALIGRIDAGLPIAPIWSRGQYLLAQFRHQVAIVLAPLMAIIGWIELVGWWSSDWPAEVGPISTGLPALLALGGAGFVFLLAPVMIRHIWDTVPLAEGPLRQRLADLCATYRVRFRELLLWRTFGGMVNAAVMGVIAPVRYMLLSDALLEHLPAEQVEAVMAHEIAHVRKRHLVWLLVIAAGAMILMETLCLETIRRAARVLVELAPTGAAQAWLADGDVQQVSAMVMAAVFWLALFGWVSRQFERQADSFAVAHLARRRDQTRIDPEAIRTMVQALEQVAALNHVSPTARSWRHGSIAWRQRYLQSLAGARVDRLPIDRRIRCINSAGVIVTIVLVVLNAL